MADHIFTVYTEVAEIAPAVWFALDGIGSRFHATNHDLHEGDRVKITIQKVEAKCQPSATTPPEASSSS